MCIKYPIQECGSGDYFHEMELARVKPAACLQKFLQIQELCFPTGWENPAYSEKCREGWQPASSVIWPPENFLGVRWGSLVPF